MELDLSNPLSPSGTLSLPFDPTELTSSINDIVSVLDATRTSVELIGNAAGMVSSLRGGISSIGNIMPKGYTISPTIKDSATGIWNSLKEIGYATIAKAKYVAEKQVKELANVAPAALELAIQNVLSMVDDYTEQIINQLESVTGYPMNQLYNMCILGIKMYRTYRIVKQFNANQNKQGLIELPDTDGNDVTKTRSGLHASFDLDENILKQELKTWLQDQTNAIWNGFLIITIKDELQDIKNIFSNFTNCSETNLEAQMSSLDGLMSFFEAIGLDETQSPDGIGAAALTGDINAYANALKEAGIEYGISLGSGVGNSFVGSLNQGFKNSVSIKIQKKFNIVVVDTNAGHLELRMFVDPNDTNHIGDLVKELNGIGIFTQGVIIQICNYAREVWNSESDDKSGIKFQGKSYNLYYTIDFLIQPEETSGEVIDDGQSPSSSLYLESLRVDEGSVEIDNYQKTFIISDLLRILVGVIRSISSILDPICHLVSNYKINKARMLSSSRIRLTHIIDAVRTAQGFLSTKDENSTPNIITDEDLAKKIKNRLGLEGEGYEELILSEEQEEKISDLLEGSYVTPSIPSSDSSSLGSSTSSDSSSTSSSGSSSDSSNNESLNGSSSSNRKPIHLFLNPGNINQNIEVNPETGVVYYIDPDRSIFDSELYESLANPDSVLEDNNFNNDSSIDPLIGLRVSSDESEGGIIEISHLNICSIDNNEELGLPNPNATITDIESAEAYLNSSSFKDILDLAGQLGDPSRGSENSSDGSGDSSNGLEDSSDGTEDSSSNQEDGGSQKDLENLVDSLPSAKGNYAIIEFCKESATREAIIYNYEDYIKPGQSITEDTILGRCTQNGLDRKIKSIFSTGRISKSSEGGFARIYKDNIRHFIIQDYKLASVEIFSEDDKEALIEDLRTETNLFSFISNNLCESRLPSILLRREQEYTGVSLDSEIHPDGQVDIWPIWLNHLQVTRDNYYNQFNTSEDEKTKEIRETGMNPSKLQEIVDKRLEGRVAFINGSHDYGRCINGIIDLYQNYLGKMQLCQYDLEFRDCKGLCSYYIDLLESINLGDDSFSYAIRYYEVLSSIIANRRNYEKSFDIVGKLDSDGAGIIANSSYGFTQTLNFIFKVTPNYQEVYDYIDSHKRSLQKDETEAELIEKIRKLSNLYIFYRDNKTTTPVNSSLEKEILDNDYYELVRQENNQLTSFWSEVIYDYKNHYDIYKIIERIRNIGSERKQEAIWPTPITIEIDGRSYQHYLFIPNPDEEIDNEADDDGFSEAIPENIEEPTLPSQDGVEAEASSNAADLLDDTSDPLMPNEPGGDNSTESEVPFTSLKYWLKYMAIATGVTLIPTYWCTGLMIPLPPVYIPMPAIYTPITVIFLKEISLLMVIGLTIRGIMFDPLILYVNLGADVSSITSPLLYALEAVKTTFMGQMVEIEMGIPNIAQVQINSMESTNARLRAENIQLNRMAEEIKRIQFPGFEDLKKAVRTEILKSI